MSKMRNEMGYEILKISKRRCKMVKKKSVKKMDTSCCSTMSCKPHSGCAYGLGVIGAAVYYISMATGFWVVVLGVLKALVWPAFLVFELLKLVAA